MAECNLSFVECSVTIPPEQSLHTSADQIWLQFIFIPHCSLNSKKEREKKKKKKEQKRSN